MKLIVDANIIMSVLIKNSKTWEIFSRDDLELYSADYVLEEIEKHHAEILSKTHRTIEDFNHIFSSIKCKLNIIYLVEFTQYLDKAHRICPDPDDVPYFALALHLNIPIWSQDKDLKNQKYVKVYSTEDLIKKYID